MIVAVYILLMLVATGIVLRLLHRSDLPAEESDTNEPAAADTDECCGMHATCEKDSLISAMSTRIVYYDDEELDRFRGRTADGYTAEETEEFRNVLLTLLPDDIAGWGRSIQLRGITLPADVRDELLMIVGEKRLSPTS